MTRRHQGITLIEIVVASFLLSLVLLVAIQVFVPAMRAWTDGQRRSEVGQSLLVTSNWIGDDMLRSAPDSCELTEESIFSLKCTPGKQVNHEVKFSTEVAYWLDGTTLYRAQRENDNGETGPITPLLADLDGYDSKRRVGSDITIFEVELKQPWLIELHLKCDKEGRSSEIKTGFASIYAPFEPEEEAEPEEETP